DRALDAVGVHVVDQLGELRTLEERVPALEVVLLDAHHPVGLGLVAHVDVHEAVDGTGHCPLPFRDNRSCSAVLSTFAVAVSGTSFPESVSSQQVGTLNALRRVRTSRVRSSSDSDDTTSAPTACRCSVVTLVTCACWTPLIARSAASTSDGYTVAPLTLNM